MKPGLGARRCVRCGKKIEGEESRLLNACPFCGLPFGGTGAPSFTPSPGSYAPPQPQGAAYQQYQPPSPYAAPPYGAPPAYGAPPPSAYGGPPPTFGGYKPAAAKSGGALVWIIVITLLLVGTGVGIAVLIQLRSSKTSSSTVTPIAPLTADPVTPPTAEDPVTAAANDPTKPHAKGTPTATTPIAGNGRPFPSSTGFNNPNVVPPITGIGGNTGGTTPKSGTCKATLTLTLFNPSTRTCSFNTSANQSPGTLIFPCTGGGAATGTFGKQTFRGSVSNGNFTLSNIDPFTFNGCNVESSQTIFGQISSGTGSYTYSERETGGTCSGVSTCRASARVSSSTPVAAGGGSSSGF